MGQIDFAEILILASECILLALILLFLFSLRKTMGLSLLYVTLGVMQFLQVFLANTLYYEVSPGFIISPGSIVLFSGSLFTVLLIYIREDADEARKIIYAILVANVVMILFQLIFGYSIDTSIAINSYGLPPDFFFSNVRILIVGTALLFIDSIIVIVLFEYFSHYFKSLFGRIFLTMTIVLTIDSILFSTLAFNGSDHIKKLIITGVISKTASAFLYSLIFTLYLLFFEKRITEVTRYSFNDIFSWLTYRQKFEQLTIRSERLKKESDQSILKSEQRFRNIFNFSPISLLEIDISKIYRYYDQLREKGINDLKLYFEKNPEELGFLFTQLNYLDINQATLDLYEARTKEEFYQNLDQTITQSSAEVYKKELILLSAGINDYVAECAIKTITGKLLHVQFSFNALDKDENERFVVLVALSNISDRVKSENSLKKSEDLLKESQRVGKLGSWEHDYKKDEVFWSDELFRMFGMEPNEIVPSKDKFLSHIHPNDLEEVKTTFADSYENKKEYQHSHRFLLPDGTIKYVNERCVTEYDITGNAVRLLGTVNDITDDTISSIKQEELATRNKLILDTTLDGFILVDENGQIRDVNKAYSRLTGFSKAELLKMSILDLDVEQSVKEVLETVNKIHTLGGLQFETKHKTKIGHHLKFSVSASLMHIDDQQFTAAFCRDMTYLEEAEETLRKSEEQYRSIVNHANVCIHELNLEGEFILLNPAGLLILGVEEDSEILGQKYSQGVSAKDALRIQDLFNLAINDGISSSFEFLSADNKTYISSCFIPIVENGSVQKVIGISNDITERKQAEQELRDSKNFLQNALNSMQDGISVVTKDGVQIEANPALCRMTGFSKDELIGRSLPRPYWPEEEYENIQKIFGRRKLRANDSFEFIFKRKNEQRFPVILSPAPILNDDREIVNYIATIKDVTEQKEREKALLESENRFKTIFEQAAVGVSLHDSVTGDYLRINNKYGTIVGYSSEEIQELSYKAISHSDDLIREDELMDQMINGSIVSFSIEKRMITKEEKTIWVKLSVSPMMFSGTTVTQHIGVIEDITHIKLLDNWKSLHGSILESIAKGAQVSKIITDINKGIDNLIPGAMSSVLLVNDKNRLVASGQSRLPKKWIKSIDNLEQGPKVGSCGTSAFTKKRVISGDISTDPLWADFKEMALENGLYSCWSEPIISSEGSDTLGTFGVYFDQIRYPSPEEIGLLVSVSKILSIVIEKSMAEKELLNYKIDLERLVEKRTVELEKRNEELESFSYSVSHDLRAPLTRIDGFSKALLDIYKNELDKTGQHYIERIRASTQNMGLIIEDILTLSRVSRQNLKKSKVNLSQISIQILRQLKKSSPDREVNIDIESNLIADMDPGLARVLLENLLSNAWKFSDNSVISNIEFGSHEYKGEKWLYVKDNGIGFNMKYADQLFLPFKRLHTSKNIDGFGVGLATVKRIVDKHGGLIRAESKKGNGSTFYFKV